MYELDVQSFFLLRFIGIFRPEYNALLLFSLNPRIDSYVKIDFICAISCRYTFSVVMMKEMKIKISALILQLYTHRNERMVVKCVSR